MKTWLGTLMGVALLAGTAQAEATRVPQTVKAEPMSPRSEQMSTQAARAEIMNDPQGALRYADQGIAANPADPWPYYNKGDALARLGRTDLAVAAYSQAEQHFAPNDRWGRSVAIFGRARALSEASRCAEARTAFNEYASLMQDDQRAVSLAHRYAEECKPSAETAH